MPRHDAPPKGMPKGITITFTYDDDIDAASEALLAVLRPLKRSAPAYDDEDVKEVA